MENIIEKLNTTIELINKRNGLKQKLNELQQYKNYIESPQKKYRQFKKENKNTTAMVIHIICDIAFFVFLILMIVEIRNYNTYENQIRRAFGTSDNSAILIWVYVILMIGALIMDIVPYNIKKNAYRQYIQQDNQYRSMCQSKLGEYQKALDELNSLEVYMGNPQVCIIPKDYWDNALEISGYIRNGVVKTVEEAIRLLPSKMIETNNTIFCQNCGTQNIGTGGFCVRCGKKLI